MATILWKQKMGKGKQRRAYPMPAGVAAGIGAGCRLDEARPHLASGLLHPLPQEPHRRICAPDWHDSTGSAHGRTRSGRPWWCRARTFERGADALDAFFVRHGAEGGALRFGGLGPHADARRGAAAVALRHFCPSAGGCVEGYRFSRRPVAALELLVWASRLRDFDGRIEDCSAQNLMGRKVVGPKNQRVWRATAPSYVRMFLKKKKNRPHVCACVFFSFFSLSLFFFG